MVEARLSVHRHGVVHFGIDEGIPLGTSRAWRVIVALDADIDFASDDRQARARCVLVAPNVTRAMDAPGRVVTFLSEPGAHGTPFRDGGPAVRGIEGRAADRLLAIARAQSASATDDSLQHAELFRALRFEPAARVDRRAVEALRRLATDPDADLAPLLASQRISATRLRHLVQRDTGLALRTHRLWHRTMLAVEAIVSGSPIARAAYAAGFTDHAHFTRAFVRFIGRTPSSMHGRATWLASYADRDGPSIGPGGAEARDIDPALRPRSPSIDLGEVWP